MGARRLAPRRLAGARALRLVKGSHIVVPRLYEGDHAYLLQNDDRRIVFVIPFEREFSLIGTTEHAVRRRSGEARDRAGGDRLSVPRGGALVREAAGPAEVVWHYAGVRPLYEDGRDPLRR